DDTADDVAWMAGKLTGLRIFEDDAGKMNLGLTDVRGSMLRVSRVTRLGVCQKGPRPSVLQAARPEVARPLYQQFVAAVGQLGIPTATGIFQAEMQVELVNDGPVTLVVESRPVGGG
ncbi:MAG: D-aminoacyl-tRNA deacylase, partial [Planctomycetaceae bacterium]